MSTPLPEPGPGVLGVGGFAQAQRHRRRWDAILTCEDPGVRQRLRVSDRPQLVLAFEDCDDATLGYAVATREQVEAGLNFLQTHREGSLLVHCMHGVGRSAALALADLADRHGPGNEARAVEQLLALRPEATPNLVAVDHADCILNRRGHLLEALLASEAQRPVVQRVRRNRRDFALQNPGLFARASDR